MRAGARGLVAGAAFAGWFAFIVGKPLLTGQRIVPAKFEEAPFWAINTAVAAGLAALVWLALGRVRVSR